MYRSNRFFSMSDYHVNLRLEGQDNEETIFCLVIG